MVNGNLQKKKAIDDILIKYNAKMSALKQKRDKIISNFIEALKEKKLDDVRRLLKRL
mgnify:CR=1 FL=1